jgi:hypothetical protein
MQDEPELEYAKMKEFLSFYVERYFEVDGLPPGKRPIASLEALEKKSMKMAFNGLRQAINDCVEMSLRFDHEEVEKFDTQLQNRGIVTLSELRRRYSKSYVLPTEGRIMIVVKRGAGCGGRGSVVTGFMRVGERCWRVRRKRVVLTPGMLASSP